MGLALAEMLRCMADKGILTLRDPRLSSPGAHCRRYPCSGPTSGVCASTDAGFDDLKWFKPKTIYPLIAVRDREER
jgi:hypothetical protein